MYPLLNTSIKLNFAVQNSNFLYSVEVSPDLVQIQVRETVWSNSNPSLAHVGSDAKGFQQTKYGASTITENHFGEMQIM